MRKDDLKKLLAENLTIEIGEGSDMCGEWLEVSILFDGEVIAADKGLSKSHE